MTVVFSTKVLKAYLTDLGEIDRYSISFLTQENCRAVVMNTKN